MPRHRHLLKYYDMTGENISDATRNEVLRGYDQNADPPPTGAFRSGEGATSEEGNGEGHAHVIKSDGDHSHTIANIDPVYFYLWYIMKS
jgi:hypothetical protein